MGPGRIAALMLGVTTLVGCACHRAAVSPRPALDTAVAGVEDLATPAAERAFHPESLQMQANVVARGSSLLVSRSFIANLLWREPGDIKLRILNPQGFEAIQILQRDGNLTFLDTIDRARPIMFTGPIETLDPEVRESMPIDAACLVAVPLIDTVLSDRLSALELIDRPRGSCWRDHLFLRGDPADSASEWWRTFDEEIWAVREDTATVEGLALRLPSEEGDAPWIWIVFDEYQEFEGRVLPSRFHLAAVKRPWRRMWRGEQWHVEGVVTVHRVDPPQLRNDRVFTLPIPRGAEIYPLSELAVMR